MKKKVIIFGIIMSFIAGIALAEDTMVQLEIKNALDNPKIQNAIYKDIELYWGAQKHPQVIKKFGEFKTSKRSNKIGKSNEEACQWALATAIKALQERARREGGNAVIGIKSNIKSLESSSSESYECLCGTMMVNIALKGQVVKLNK